MVWFSALIVALLFAMLLGLVIERLIIRPMIGEPLFSIAVITLGLEAVLRTLGIDAIGVNDQRASACPGRPPASSSAERSIYWSWVFTVIAMLVSFAAVYLFFRTRMGIAMRAVAYDQEASMAQGIPVGRVFAIAWAAAAALAVLGAICASMSPIGQGTATASVAALAFRALPAVILGGLDSVVGALVGGLAVGLAEVFAGTYLAEYTDTLGVGFQLIVPVPRDAGRAADQTVRTVRHARDQAGVTMWGRPNLHTSYQSEMSIFPTWTQRILITLLGLLAVLLAFDLPVINQIPVVSYLGDDDWIRLTTQAVIFVVAALGLNLLTGVSGQVSLGHAFFMGVGAYTAAYLGGESGTDTWGHELPMWIWLPGAGICAALIGLLIAPAAVRVRGLYLGILTVGLVFIGIHLSRLLPEISGPAEVGRNFPPLELKLWKEDEPVHLLHRGRPLAVVRHQRQRQDVPVLPRLMIVGLLVAKNLVRSRTGRALQAIRDRDVAAEIMGVPEVKYKLIAFAISSFFAGVAGAVFASFVGRLPPEYWDLILSVEFIAILLVGGAGTVAGTLVGTFFVVLLPRFMEEFAGWMSEQSSGSGPWASFWDGLVSRDQNDFGFISSAEIAPGFPLPVSALDTILYGLLVIIFLLFEPLGLYGIWVKIRNYWKGWPFSY